MSTRGLHQEVESLPPYEALVNNVAAPPQSVREWSLIHTPWLQREASMAGKDKGGRAAKTPASKSAKEKRQDKRDKKAGKSSGLI